MRNPKYGILLPQVQNLQELNVMLADKLEEWALEFKAEGDPSALQEVPAKHRHNP
jgi:hypothetical protein